MLEASAKFISLPRSPKNTASFTSTEIRDRDFILGLWYSDEYLPVKTTLWISKKSDKPKALYFFCCKW